MPVQKTVTAYTFEELSEEAKKRAREKARDINTDDGWYEYTIEDADTIAALMGIELDRRSYRTKTGEKKESGAPDIQFSGFASRGRGHGKKEDRKQCASTHHWTRSCTPSPTNWTASAAHLVPTFAPPYTARANTTHTNTP